LRVGLRAADTSTLRDQSPVPAQQRGGRDDERPPTCSRQKTAGSGKEDSISGFQLRPSNVATQDTELVAEHDDLQLLELTRAEAKCGQLQRTSNNEVHKRDEQGGSS
jgi:hypothetical protein